MKNSLSDIPIELIIHNDLKCYVSSGYGGKNIKTWPFYKFIKILIKGDFKLARILWIDWLVNEFFKYNSHSKFIGGMYHGSVHQYALLNIKENKNYYWKNPKLLKDENVREGAKFLVDKRIKMINSILNKGYQINKDDPIIAVSANDKYVLKGGHHRAVVMYVLGHNSLPGTIVYSKTFWECKTWLSKITNFLS